MNPHVIDFDHGISAVDSAYVRTGLDAIHLIVEGGKAAIVDTGTANSVPHVLRALKQKGVAEADVDYVFLTHVHLDHAGGTGELIRHLPNARVVVHPRGARHIVDPGKLVAGTVAVYGEEAVRKSYGKILPVDAGRIIEAPDGFSLALNGRPFLFLDTPGHARHHNAIFDERSRSFFTGDIFGVSYRELDVDGMEFIFPATTPVHFDPVAAHASIERLMSYRPVYAFLTHFSRITHLPRHAATLHELIDRYVKLAGNVHSAGTDRHRILREKLTEALVRRVENHGCKLPETEVRVLLEMDIEVNTQGLEVWLDSRASLRG